MSDDPFPWIVGVILVVVGCFALNDCTHSDSAMQMRQVVTHPERGMTCVTDRLTGRLACVKDAAPNP